MPFTDDGPPPAEPYGLRAPKTGKAPDMDADTARRAPNLVTVATVTLVVLLAAGTPYALADALKALPSGDAPGDGPSGAGFFVGLPALALLLGGFGSIYVAARGHPLPPLAWLLAPLGAAFMLVHFYSFDDYYGGYSTRITDGVTGGAALWPWILATAGLLAGALTWRYPRAGLRCSGAAMILCALTVFFVPFGH